MVASSFLLTRRFLIHLAYAPFTPLSAHVPSSQFFFSLLHDFYDTPSRLYDTFDLWFSWNFSFSRYYISFGAVVRTPNARMAFTSTFTFQEARRAGEEAADRRLYRTMMRPLAGKYYPP